MKTQLTGQSTSSGRMATCPESYRVLILLAMIVIAVACGEKKPTAAPSPPEVQTADVIQQDVPIYTEWVAQLNGDTNAEIVPKVQGYLLKQNYKEGFFVNKGELLFEIDPRPFVAALDQAKAQPMACPE